MATDTIKSSTQRREGAKPQRKAGIRLQVFAPLRLCAFALSFFLWME
jgi:hypothetical protein